MSDIDRLVEEWLFELPLYTPVPLEIELSTAVEAVLRYSATKDSYCPGCGQHATFQGAVSEQTERIAKAEQQRLYLRMHGTGSKQSEFHLSHFNKAVICTRAGHVVQFHFTYQDSSIIKIGQYPSLADISIGDTSQFSKALGKERLHELNKAIGLAAHGVGIGSYVYLRRVFESLIEEAHIHAKSDINWDEEEYQKGRMKEKVALLKAHLPQFIVEHPQLYGILSLGIHELTEDKCLENFEPLKSSILVIAEEKMHDIQRKARYEQASAAIAKASEQIKQ